MEGAAERSEAGLASFWGGARVLSYIAYLRRFPSLSFIPLEPYPPLRGTFPTRGRLCVGDSAFPLQPPPLRGTSFQRKEGESTRAPSLGRGCRAQRGGVGFFFCGARVLSYIAYLRRSPSLSFIPLECTCQQKLDTKLKKLGIKIEYLYKIQ